MAGEIAIYYDHFYIRVWQLTANSDQWNWYLWDEADHGDSVCSGQEITAAQALKSAKTWALSHGRQTKRMYLA